MEKIPDVNDGEKSLCSGPSLRTLLPSEKLLLEHVFDGVAKGGSGCLTLGFNRCPWRSGCIWMRR